MALFSPQRIGRMFRVLREKGPREFASRAFGRLSYLFATYETRMLVANDDAAKVDWTIPRPWNDQPVTVSEGTINIAWLMSPPGETSGGHQNLFRFIDFAEKAGHKCTIYFYDSDPAAPSIDGVKAMLRSSPAYASVQAEIVSYDRDRGVRPETQALFATGWETAYPVYLDPSLARRFYFVQDFEPGFYPLGTESMLAENTYRFGFHGITAGGWLSHKLSTEYGMAADSFDFAVDKKHYSVINLEPRKEVFFYARPVTARRAFEFGILALKDFAELRPDVTINLGGWDVSSWAIPFEYRNLAAMDITELNAVYNRCAAGLVMSLSNMSLLPLELMSSGVAPVVNDGPNNRMVSNNPYIEYVPASPAAFARKLAEVLDRPDAVERSLAMSQSVIDVNWEDSGAQFTSAIERAMRG
jgi:hypothetical protein